MRPSLRFLAVVVIGWAGVRAATLGLIPGAELFRITPGQAKAPPIVATEFGPLAPLQAAPPASPIGQYPASVPYPTQPVLVPVYYAAQISRPVAVTRIRDAPQPRPWYELASNEWPLLRPAALSPESRQSRAAEPRDEPPPPVPPLEPRLDRLQLTTWAMLRNQSSTVAGSRSLATGGQLGASQAGARLIYNYNRQLALVARLSSEVGRRGGEAALGIRVRPFVNIPVWLTAERRQKIGQYGGGRSDFALFAEGGLYQRRLAGRFVLDGYIQGGVVGAKSRDLFVDGGVAVTRPLLRQFSAGFGLWGGAQPGLSRIDAGPRLTVQLPHHLKAHIDWRQKLAGNAQPGSGPTLTLAGDF